MVPLRWASPGWQCGHCGWFPRWRKSKKMSNFQINPKHPKRNYSNPYLAAQDRRNRCLNRFSWPAGTQVGNGLVVLLVVGDQLLPLDCCVIAFHRGPWWTFRLCWCAFWWGFVPRAKVVVAFALGYQTRDDRRPEHWHELNTPRRARCTFIKVYFTQEKKRRAMIRFSDFDFLYLLFDR